MTDNRNTILAVILSGIVLIAWQYFYNVPQMEKQRAQTQMQAELAKPTPQATPGDTTPQNGPTPAPSATTPNNTAAQPAAIVSRDAAIAATPRIKIETPSIIGSIALKGARIDDLSLVKFRETVDPASPAIVLYSPSNTAEPYYAEFGWVPASGVTAKLPDIRQWRRADFPPRHFGR
jgi:YidC/Oxa1 family membrane protein insertase